VASNNQQHQAQGPAQGGVTEQAMQYAFTIAESADIWKGEWGGPFQMTVEPNEAQLSCGSPPESMSDEALAALVRDGIKQFAKLVPYVRELRERFTALQRGHANIAGCKTWSEFCERILDRTPAAVRKALAGGKETDPSKPRNILLSALKRVTATLNEEYWKGDLPVRFSVSEEGNLLLRIFEREKEVSRDEIPEAIVLKPGGPGLQAGDFGCVNLWDGPFDFTMNALYILPALKFGDPTIIFRGNTNVEFCFKENYTVYIAPWIVHGKGTIPKHIPTEEDLRRQREFEEQQRQNDLALEELNRKTIALRQKTEELRAQLPSNIQSEFYDNGSHLHGITIEQLEKIVEALQPAPANAGTVDSGNF
jgi:hypothetical protein